MQTPVKDRKARVIAAIAVSCLVANAVIAMSWSVFIFWFAPVNAAIAVSCLVVNAVIAVSCLVANVSSSDLKVSFCSLE